MRRTSIALATILSLVIGACTAAPSPTATATPEQLTEADIQLTQPVTITVWHNQTGELVKGWEAMIADFNQTNGKGITVKSEFQGNFTQIYQKMLGAIQAGSLPEAVAAVENQVADYAKAGVIVDLGEYINSKKNGLSKESLGDIYEEYIEANKYPQYGNRILSFPFIKSLSVNMVNLDLLKELGFSEPPKTWDEYEKMARAALRKGPDGKVTRWGSGGITTDGFFASVVSRGGKMLNEDGTVGWGDAGLETLKFVQRCYEEGFCWTEQRAFDWQDRFGEGNLLFAQGTSTGRPFIRAAFKKPINWQIFGSPTSGSGKSKTVQFGGVLAITKSTPEKQLAAWEFVKWFTDRPQTAKWSVISSYMPVRKSAPEDTALKEHWATKDKEGRQAFELIPTTFAVPSIRGFQEVRNFVDDAMTKVRTKRATPEAALKEAVDKSNQVLKENR